MEPVGTSALALPEYTVIGKSAALWKANQRMDEARTKNLLPSLGSSAYAMDQTALKSLPQGDNTPLDKVLLQAPGVSYDSAISNPDFHVRNEYANVQYRVNGIQLPDGVSALGPVLETGFVGTLTLLDGALPAQYGLRTAGVVDISTRTEFEPGGSLDLYAGSWSTLSGSLQYGGREGRTEYFATARYLQSGQGMENAMPTADPVHDATEQGKCFAYASTLFNDSTRLTAMAGAFAGRFQIPDVTGQQPLGDFGPPHLSSALLNENETDQFYFGLLALQTHTDRVDTQVSAFTRQASVDFVPDVFDDLAFNDVASAVLRQSLLNGLQCDGAWRLDAAHTLRAGLDLGLEQTRVEDLTTVLPLDAGGNPLPTPLSLDDGSSRLGLNAGAYVQDEWRLLGRLTLNAGLRYDWMAQYVSAAQLSPRCALICRPWAGTELHAGVARYFTPPMQAQSAPNNITLFQNTTQQQAITQADPVQPERATTVDIGVDQTLLPGLGAGLDTYDKESTDTLDDGQFGQAVVLEQYNFARGRSRGAECKVDYAHGGLRAYANASLELTQVEDVVSSQYLIGDPVELAYLSDHYVSSSDAQVCSASWGGSWAWHGLLASLDGLYGSGLAAGFANEQHAPGYTQWNASLACPLDPWRTRHAPTLRLSAINLFDHSYVLREATGIGEFAPQYGPRRGLFAELTQRF
jgi:outer membrane receptor protein involved in Fe transport